MNDTLAIPAPTVSVPPSKGKPSKRPWWAVRLPLILLLGLLVALLVALIVQRNSVNLWMVKDLPVNDNLVLRFAGY